MSKSQKPYRTSITKRKIWITWENHRRSRELSRVLDAKYIVVSYDGFWLVRYLVLSGKTLFVLTREKPDLVFCQNPSVVLAALLCALKIIFSYFLIVDRHTNFKLNKITSKHPKWLIFHMLSRFSIRQADRTIVTNQPLADVVVSMGGRAIVLPDKLPKLQFLKRARLKSRFNYLFICTFSHDEPVQEVGRAFSQLPSDFCLYITGNFRSYKNWENLENMPNVVLLGYIPEKEYLEYLYGCDVTIVLTRQPMTLNCGSYESVVAGKPQIVADSEVIRDYFNTGAIYTELDVNSIKSAVLESAGNLSRLRKQVTVNRHTLEARWTKLFEKFRIDLGKDWVI